LSTVNLGQYGVNTCPDFLCASPVCVLLFARYEKEDKAGE
jgi:hypothetical protein